MTVYVDDMYRYPMGRYRGMQMSHMIADTEEELHAMASKIGVARKWYQGDHYDICRSKRTLAVKNGAIEITIRQLGQMSIRRRRRGTSDPATEGFREPVEPGKTLSGDRGGPALSPGPSRSGEA